MTADATVHSTFSLIIGMSGSILSRMLLDFPTLLPAADFFTPTSSSSSPGYTAASCSPLHHYHGYLPILSQQYRIDIRLQHSVRSGASSKSRPALFLSVDRRLHGLLSAFASVLQQRWKQSADIHAFLIDLRDVITHAASSSPSSSALSPSAAAPPTAAFYRSVLAELQSIGWQQVVKLDDDMRSLQLAALDMDKQQHVLSFSIPPAFPSLPPTVSCELPVPFPALTPPPSSLSGLYSHFASLVLSLSPYFAALRELDSQCVVLEPSPPSLSLPYRRLAVGPAVSVHVTLSPLSLSSLPSVRFLGPDQQLQPLRSAWQLNARHWKGLRIREELEAGLGVHLQAKAAAAADAANGVASAADCAICLCYEGDNAELPVIVCANSRCGRCYHPRCLHAWLSASVSSSVVFDVCVGRCINCEEPISVPIQR